MYVAIVFIDALKSSFAEEIHEGFVFNPVHATRHATWDLFIFRGDNFNRDDGSKG